MLRILFVTQDDPFYLPRFFRELVPRVDTASVHVAGVVIQAPLGKKTLRGLVRQMLDFYGPLGFVLMGVRFVLYRGMNYLAVRVFRGAFPGAFSVEHVLRRSGWSILRARNVNSEDFLSTLAPLKLDLLVSVAASQKFRTPLLRAPRLGCINLHTAKLPKNRGMMPNFWSLYHADTEPVSAVTVHRMNEELDDGPIVLQEEFRLDPQESLHELILRTKILGARAVVRALEMFQHGEPAYLPNDRSGATYNTFPTREDVRKFRAKGLRLL